jgi:hypothetical protein
MRLDVTPVYSVPFALTGHDVDGGLFHACNNAGLGAMTQSIGAAVFLDCRAPSGLAMTAGGD